MAYLGVKHKLNAPYRPQANPTERSIMEIKNRIKKYFATHQQWDASIDVVAFAIRGSVNSDTGFTPNVMHIGRELHNPFAPHVELTPVGPHSHATELITQMQEVHRLAMLNIVKSKAVMAQRYNAKRQKHNFEVGVVVTKDNKKFSKASDNYSAGYSGSSAQRIDLYHY
jgi:RNase adaptor protein for sRNA GlmZ degradation